MRTDIVSIRKVATISKKPEASLPGDRCEHCNAELRRERASVGEIVLNAICLLILLAILAPVGYFAEQWIERHLERPLWHLPWHEPLDNWGRLPERPGLLPHHHQLCTGTRSWVDMPTSSPCRVLGVIYLL
jgi:hypothetical protein